MQWSQRHQVSTCTLHKEHHNTTPHGMRSNVKTNARLARRQHRMRTTTSHASTHHTPDVPPMYNCLITGQCDIRSRSTAPLEAPKSLAVQKCHIPRNHAWTTTSRVEHAASTIRFTPPDCKAKHEPQCYGVEQHANVVEGQTCTAHTHASTASRRQPQSPT